MEGSGPRRKKITHHRQPIRYPSVTTRQFRLPAPNTQATDPEPQSKIVHRLRNGYQRCPVPADCWYETLSPLAPEIRRRQTSRAPTNTSTQASAQSNFEQAVVLSLHVWPALTLAVQNSWGGESSDDKRDWFAGAVVDLFAPFERLVDGVAAPRLPADSDYEEPDADYLEEFMLNVMMDEFDVNVDDASGYEIARQILTLRADCARGRTDALDELRTKYESRKGKKVQAQAAATENEDDDDDSDSGSDASDGPLDWADDANETNDVVMDEAPQLVPASRPKPQPEVDDDGFTTVVRRR